MNFEQFPIVQKALKWLMHEDGHGFLNENEHSLTRDIFQARLDRMSREMEKEHYPEDLYPLLVAVAGEFGNNSFDHNLGNWTDEPGVFFGFDLKQRFFLLADRGRGILSTLKRVKPDLRNEMDAINIAFKYAISGRAPEKRGNGLKFVDRVVKGQKWSFYFQSGDAVYEVYNGLGFYRADQKMIKGVFALVFF